MSDMQQLAERIGAALNRIDEAIGSGGGDAAELEAAQAALAEEKMASAQLEERVRSLKDQHEAQLREAQSGMTDRIAALETALRETNTRADEAIAQNRQLRQSNQRLQASLQSLREAGEDGVEPHLINQAMMSELEGLRAARAADRAEVDEILTALKPMLEEGANA